MSAVQSALVTDFKSRQTLQAQKFTAPEMDLLRDLLETGVRFSLFEKDPSTQDTRKTSDYTIHSLGGAACLTFSKTYDLKKAVSLYTCRKHEGAPFWIQGLDGVSLIDNFPFFIEETANGIAHFGNMHLEEQNAKYVKTRGAKPEKKAHILFLHR